MNKVISTAVMVMCMCTVALNANAQYDRVNAGSFSFWHGSQVLHLDAKEQAFLNRYINANHCLVQKMAPSKRQFFARAVNHISSALNDPDTARLVLGKKDWQGTNMSGAQIWAAVQRGAAINVFTYQRTTGNPCTASKVSLPVNSRNEATSSI